VLHADSIRENPDDITGGIDSADGGSAGDPGGAGTAGHINGNEIKGLGGAAGG
jgi:hypothetical protein